MANTYDGMTDDQFMELLAQDAIAHMWRDSARKGKMIKAIRHDYTGKHARRNRRINGMDTMVSRAIENGTMPTDAESCMTYLWGDASVTTARILRIGVKAL